MLKDEPEALGRSLSAGERVVDELCELAAIGQLRERASSSSRYVGGYLARARFDRARTLRIARLTRHPRHYRHLPNELERKWRSCLVTHDAGDIGRIARNVCGKSAMNTSHCRCRVRTLGVALLLLANTPRAGLQRAMQNLQQLPTTESDDVGALVIRAGGGDRGSWDSLVERFASMVLSIARGYGLSPADAADVSQTTWLRFVQHLDRIEQPERVGGWLATTARRESLRVLRMSGRQIPTDFDEFANVGDAPAVAPDSYLLSTERDVALSRIFAQMPPRCECILRFLARDGAMSYEDLGRLLDMPIGSIGPTRARCLERLRRLAVSAGLSVSDNAA